MNQHIRILILMIAISALAGCKRAPNPSATQANSQATAQAVSDKAIETEIVTTAPISGVELAG